jgi:hypothetical protein
MTTSFVRLRVDVTSTSYHRWRRQLIRFGPHSSSTQLA